MLIEYGADPEAIAQQKDFESGANLTCDQLAQVVGFANYEQVKTDTLVTSRVRKVTAQIKRNAREHRAHSGGDALEEAQPHSLASQHAPEVDGDNG